MSSDNESEEGYEIFMKLLTSGSQIINGQFITSIRLEI